MQVLRLYDSLSRRKKVFKPIRRRVGLYTCGPTVYDYAHIGNFRTFVFYDIVRRTLRHLGYPVQHVMNITDVGHLAADSDFGEEKMAAAALRERKNAWDVAKAYTKSFLEDAAKLNVLPANKLPRATEHIPEQVALIKELERKGFTYRTSDGIYFDTAKFPKYGRLSGQTLKDKVGGKRVAIGDKRQASDFALWKFSPTGVKRDMEWPSPWGKGFPGWHIECSAMSRKYLRQPFDIHSGGVDHLAVHHENEIAQSEAAYGKPLANYWLHGEFLIVKQARGGFKRMGKSEGNLMTVSDVATTYNVDPLALRYLFLQTHYRKPLQFDSSALLAANQALVRLREHVARLPRATRIGVPQIESAFAAAIANDFDIPKALAIVWQLVRTTKKYEGAAVRRSLRSFDTVLGLGIETARTVSTIPDTVQQLASEREKARKEKRWADADSARDEAQRLGYRIEDTPSGPQIKKI
ncbi:MAG: cysteine--tRNA ligase [Patescibacteria group bacterium]